jgi:cytochrome c peroxidase
VSKPYWIPVLLGLGGLALLGVAASSHVQQPTAWPRIAERPDNPSTLAKVKLGRTLFFDPVLSNDNRTSCAHCHHPDLGFSDGLPRGRGYGAEGAGASRHDGIVLPRHTTALWNVAYAPRLYVDGRAKDLEDQARFPITTDDEMKQDPQTLVAELKALDEYGPMFDRAFAGRNGSAITFENVCRALAVFERTLVSRHSRYDRFVSGDLGALTPSEKCGLALFQSERTRCSSCHVPPLFTNNEFRVTGVGDVAGLTPDPHKDTAESGRGGGPNTAYRVPTLRNVTLHPPYMHNGSIRSLSDVLNFYSHGGGRGRGLDLPHQDAAIRPFPLSAAEKDDLIAFLGSLTDTSSMPPIPRSVPSGLEVVPRLPPFSRKIR